ncbi:hypothetical protein L1049_014029 [Liquidambar formosana]|uniref:Uncharacterized protein n=1 Tax=Liquidambar formosana TaxID=63359 RepID=A0AAP0RLB9_LIQFO
MLENRQGGCKAKLMIGASKYTPITSDEGENMFTYKLEEVEGDGSFFPSSEDEVLGLEHLLAEPRCNENMVESLLGFDTFDPQKCFNSEDFSHAVEYDQMKIDSGVLDSKLTQDDEKTKLEFIDGLSQGTEEGFLHKANGLPSSCEDYLLGTKFADEVSKLDFGTCEGSCLGKVGLESYSSGFNGRDCGAKISKLSTASIPMLGSICEENSFSLENMTIYELHEAFGNIFGRETLVEDKQWLKRRILFGLQNLVELDNGSNFLECGVISNENEDKTIFSSSNEFSRRASSSFIGVLNNIPMPKDQHFKRKRIAGCASEIGEDGFGLLDPEEKGAVSVSQKRLRKPPRRFIEESLDQQSRYQNRKYGNSYKSSKDKFHHIRSHIQHSQKGIGATPLVCQEESFKGACIQVPFGPPIQKGHSKKNAFLEHESKDCEDSKLLVSNGKSDREHFLSKSQDDMSEDDCITRIGKDRVRRKHHRLWTDSEVMKLIEGVSQYGVGRWTEIKRLLFSSSTHRTSVDLKDKWRNLLRASCTKLQSTREVEQGRKQGSHQMHQSVLRRVRELALLYPYPRERKSKDSFTAPPIPAATSKKLVPLSTAVRG